jgi:hypothetical protein
LKADIINPMELLALILAWPLLILIFGLVLITFADIGFLGMLVWPLAIFLLVIAFKGRDATKPHRELEQLENVRRWIVVLSIAALLPILMRYLLLASGKDFPVIILGMLAGFGFLIWGLFIKGNQVIQRANVIGGSIMIVYIYFQIWDLGEGARIVAAAVGLVIAVAISIIKLREKLT